MPLRNKAKLLKEVEHYKEELLENEAKLEQVKSNTTKDRYDVKRFQQIVDESYMMVPDSSRRLEYAMEDLAKFVKEHDSTSSLKENEWWSVAKDLLKEYERATTNGDENNKNGDQTPCVTPLDHLGEGEAF